MKQRYIEFRAWNGAKMLKNVGVHPHIAEFHGAEEEAYKTYSEGAFTVCQRFDHYKIMQFINSFDKNNKKIFEGDIVRWEGKKNGMEYSHICKVLYDENEFCGYVLESFDKGELGYIPIGVYGVNPFELEIIGNIYENLMFSYAIN